ncbi:hypothetical protein K0504_01380 [Neiella marina]|uniref:Tetratricopeptide repeat protein n=1 Tax=Neiella holothuriorum TaxID=2870530 RepID=A0ABS7EBG4_9GAMM|nr:hypothetical protein [Neiella holothuriorum]MBW8189673.1 hypothetical protein [Neiella holothuriorum]
MRWNFLIVLVLFGCEVSSGESVPPIEIKSTASIQGGSIETAGASSSSDNSTDYRVDKTSRSTIELTASPSESEEPAWIDVGSTPRKEELPIKAELGGLQLFVNVNEGSPPKSQPSSTGNTSNQTFETGNRGVESKLIAVERDVYHLERSLGHYLSISLTILSVVVAAVALLGWVTHKQNSKFNELHDLYLEKLSRLNEKSLEVTERANDINQLELKNRLIADLLVAQSTITRAYMLIPKLERSLKEIESGDPNQEMGLLAHEYIVEMERYASISLGKVHTLRQQLNIMTNDDGELTRETLSLSVRISLFFGLVYKRKWQLEKCPSLLERATAELKTSLEVFKILDSKTEKARIHFNLACYLSLLGRAEEAFAEIDEACGLNPRYLLVSKKDPDLKFVRQKLKNRFEEKFSGEGENLLV